MWRVLQLVQRDGQFRQHGFRNTQADGQARPEPDGSAGWMRRSPPHPGAAACCESRQVHRQPSAAYAGGDGQRRHTQEGKRPSAVMQRLRGRQLHLHSRRGHAPGAERRDRRPHPPGQHAVQPECERSSWVVDDVFTKK